MFHEFDLDGSGELSYQEFKEALANMGARLDPALFWKAWTITT